MKMPNPEMMKRLVEGAQRHVGPTTKAIGPSGRSFYGEALAEIERCQEECDRDEAERKARLTTRQPRPPARKA